jgi:hypothetical protein
MRARSPAVRLIRVPVALFLSVVEMFFPHRLGGLFTAET